MALPTGIAVSPADLILLVSQPSGEQRRRGSRTSGSDGSGNAASRQQRRGGNLPQPWLRRAFRRQRRDRRNFAKWRRTRPRRRGLQGQGTGGKGDPFLCEGSIHLFQIFALYPTRLYRAGRELEANNDRVFGDLRDALYFERQDHLGGDFGILLHRQTDLLGCPSDQLDIGTGFEPQVEFSRREIAAQIGDSAELAIGDRVQRTVMVAQLQGADTELFERALEPASIDVFADAEGIVPHVKQPGDDVPHERLRAE